MTNHIKSALIATAIALTGISTSATAPAFAADEINLTAGLAVQGYDVISYRSEEGPLKGSDQFTSVHDGATYYFASSENLSRFNADPARYVPAYGGYCAYGVSKGQKFAIDPLAYSVVDDVLYLNYNRSIQSRWSKKKDHHISEANEKWPGVKPSVFKR